ncbi:MAG: ElaB/YqjD/DUF883 family membrane-anchored ribosome-binding protein [Oleispira sp.]|jgi:ElaB/YqjD/DUF883 family membrane-anchored ribosome-binding protein
MKLQIGTLMLIGMLGINPLCYAQVENTKTSIEEVKKETQELLQTINSYTAEKKDEAVQKAKEGLSKLDKLIDTQQEKLDKNWHEMSQVARKKADDNLMALRQQRNQVGEWYSSMKTSSGDAWDHMKKGYSDAYKALEDSWGKSEKEFKSQQ